MRGRMRVIDSLTLRMLRSRIARTHVAPALYRAITGDEQADLRDLPAEKQMPYHSAAEQAIAALIVGEESPHRRVS